MTTTHVILRDERQGTDTRLLEASLTSNGDVLIEGRDWGDGVEQIFGEREYEWKWTIAAADVPALLNAIGTAGDVLAILQAQFGGEKAGGLAAFLQEHAIPIRAWSRLAD